MAKKIVAAARQLSTAGCSGRVESRLVRKICGVKLRRAGGRGFARCVEAGGGRTDLSDARLPPLQGSGGTGCARGGYSYRFFDRTVSPWSCPSTDRNSS